MIYSLCFCNSVFVCLFSARYALAGRFCCFHVFFVHLLGCFFFFFASHLFLLSVVFFFTRRSLSRSRATGALDSFALVVLLTTLVLSHVVGSLTPALPRSLSLACTLRFALAQQLALMCLLLLRLFYCTHNSTIRFRSRCKFYTTV